MPAAGLQALPRQITRELEHSQALLELLEREQHLLTSMQLDALPELTAAKERALKRLQQSTRARLDTLEAAGYESLESLGRQVRMPRALQRQIQALRRNIERAQEMNRRNGLLIQRGMLVNRQLMQILNGRSEDDTQLYQPPREERSSPGTLLGEA